MRAYWARFSGVESGFAPMSSSTNGRSVPTIWTASPGRSMPGSVPRISTPAAIPAPVWPAVTIASASPFFTSSVATTIEAHVIGQSMDLYGRVVRLAFVQRLRDERKFPDLEALQDQISADVRRATRLFDRLSV